MNDELLRVEASKRLKSKKQLDLAFKIIIGIPVCIIIFQDKLNFFPSLVEIASGTAVSALLLFYFLENKIWRCPRCDGSLMNMNHKRFRLCKACKHCGFTLFEPEIQKPPKDSNKTDQNTVSSGVRNFAVGSMACVSVGAFFTGNNDVMIVSALASAGIYYTLLQYSAGKSCTGCGMYIGKNKYCEWCGTKSIKESSLN